MQCCPSGGMEVVDSRPRRTLRNRGGAAAAEGDNRLDGGSGSPADVSAAASTPGPGAIGSSVPATASLGGPAPPLESLGPQPPSQPIAAPPGPTPIPRPAPSSSQSQRLPSPEGAGGGVMSSVGSAGTLFASSSRRLMDRFLSLQGGSDRVNGSNGGASLAGEGAPR